MFIKSTSLTTLYFCFYESGCSTGNQHVFMNDEYKIQPKENQGEQLTQKDEEIKKKVKNYQQFV